MPPWRAGFDTGKLGFVGRLTTTAASRTGSCGGSGSLGLAEVNRHRVHKPEPKHRESDEKGGGRGTSAITRIVLWGSVLSKTDSPGSAQLCNNTAKQRSSVLPTRPSWFLELPRIIQELSMLPVAVVDLSVFQRSRRRAIESSIALVASRPGKTFLIDASSSSANLSSYARAESLRAIRA